MAESLGDAVLSLRTDDTAFAPGVDNARVRAEELGKTLDDTSGSSVNLADKLTQTGESGKQMADAFSRAGKATNELAAAQVTAKDRTDNAKVSLGAGKLTLEEYNREILETKAALALFEEEHRKAQAELRKTLTSTNAVTGATAGQKAGMMQLTQQLGDMSTMYSMGAKPQQIFASQISQVISAIQLMGGEGGKLATFLANPWVLAVTSAAIVLGPLAAGLLSSSDAADKGAKSNETWADKLDASKHSINEVIAALREYRAEQAKANETTLDAAAAAAQAASEKLKEALAERQRLAALLSSKQATASGNAGQGTGGAAGAFTAGELSKTQALVAENNQNIAELEKSARAAVAGVATEIAKLDSDPTARIKAGFEELRKRAKATITDVTELTKRLADLNRQEDAAVKRQQASERKTGTGSASSGANTGDMVALIKQLFPGAAITATTNGKHVKGSDHYAGRAIDFVPAGGMGRYTTAEVEQILRDAGVDIRRNASGTEQLFGPGRPASKPGDHDDHFHVAWDGSASPESAQRRQEQAQRRAEQAAQTAARNQEAYNAEESRLSQQLLQVKQQGLSDADAIAANQREQVQAEADRTAQSIAASVASKKYTEEQGKLLTEINAAVAAAKIERINREHQAEALQRANDLQAGLLGNEIDALRLQEANAKTAEERRELALQILDRETEIARLKLQETIDLAKLGKATAEQARIAQDAVDKLDAGAAAQRQNIMEGTAGPLESYVNAGRMNRAQTGEKVEQLIVEELEYVHQTITDSIADRLGVKDPLLKGLISMFVQRVFIQPMAEALNSAMSSIGGSGGGMGIFGSLLGSISGAIFGGGTSLSSSSIAGAGSYDFSSIQFGSGSGIGTFGGGPQPDGSMSFAGMFADGGTIPTGSFGIVGEEGPEPIFATPAGIGVLPNSALRGMGGGQSGPSKLDVTVNGARGNREIEEMVQSGVSQGLAAYDTQVGQRTRDWAERRG